MSVSHISPDSPGGSPLRQPKRSVLADDVYESIREGLVSLRIAPDSHLNIDKLAKELHVSNTPVRQALARLEAEGLVSKEPFRGFTASRLLDSRTIAELYEYRLLIEPSNAAHAAQRRSEAEAAELESLCADDAITHLVADAPAGTELGRRDVDFHCGIARQAGNSVIVDNLGPIMARMSLYSLYGRHGAGEEAWQEHRAIAAAIRAADPNAAATAMRTHLSNGLDRMRRAFGY
jgi:DNA-binding GntR family transcriptional regulator